VFFDSEVTRLGVRLFRETLDFVFMDEEPDDFAVYTEWLTRITATNGQLIIGFTPWKGGATQVTHRYRQEFSPDRTLSRCPSTTFRRMVTLSPRIG